MNRPGLLAPPVHRRVPRTLLLLAGSLLLAAAPASGGPVHRVADVNPGPATAGSDNWWSPTQFVELGGRALFAADDGIHGVELWSTDGTAAGTELVADVCPGACWSFPREIVRAGGLVYFSADDGAHGYELWASDGTAAGTRLVADLAPGLTGSQPVELAAFGSRIAFSARREATGRELWISDGTAAGTTMIELVPGPDGSGPTPWGELGDKLLFRASDPTHGAEVWISDGTPGGTELLADTEPGVDGGPPADTHETISPLFVRLGQRAFFLAGGSPDGSALWATDGTPEGTEQLPATLGSFPYGLAAFGDRVYFSAEDPVHGIELWWTDGTPGGTELLIDLNPGPGDSRPLDLTPVGDRLLFVARDGVHGSEPWVSDGTAAGTTLLADLNPGAAPSAFFIAGLLPLAGGAVLFADDGVHGTEPWFTDGTTAGTLPLGDLIPGPIGSFHWTGLFAIDRRTTIGGKALFRAYAPDSGVELWATDGTPAGTQEIEINEQASAVAIETPFSLNALWGPRSIGAFGDGVLFGANDGAAGEEPWLSDGTPGGTAAVVDLEPGIYGSDPWGFREVENGAVFAGCRTSAPGCGLWGTDGDAVEGLHTGTGTQFVSSAQAGGLAIFLDAGGPIATDGTAAGTRTLPGPAFDGLPLLERDGWVYFGSDEPARTDGWVVEPLAEVRPGPEPSESYPLAAAGEQVVFAADDGVHGREPWALAPDGSGAQLLADVRPGPESGLPDPDGLLFLGDVPGAGAAGLAFFVADDGGAGEEPWISGGIPASTGILRDLFPGPRSSEVRWLTGAGDRVFFVAEDGVHGRELWTSDGTLAGTRLVADLVPGPGSSLPTELTLIAGRVYFSAHTVEHGRELWVSDGAAAGTRRLTDIAPGPLPSSPMALAASGGWLWFYATDGESGRELWRLGLPGTIFADSFESGDTSAWTASAP